MSLRNSRGFSLLELVVVLLVAGIVLAITTPSINRFLLGARLRDSATMIAGEIRLARHKAVTNSSRTWFYTVNGTNTYWVGEQRWLGGSTYAATAWKGPYSLPGSVRVVNANWAGLNYFQYMPDGRSSSSGSMSLVSIVGPPDTITVNVDLGGAVWR